MGQQNGMNGLLDPSVMQRREREQHDNSGYVSNWIHEQRRKREARGIDVNQLHQTIADVVREELQRGKSSSSSAGGLASV